MRPPTLTHRQCLILGAVLRHNDPCSMRELRAASDLPKQATVNLVGRMVRRGYLGRIERGTRRFYVVSPLGRELLEEAIDFYRGLGRLRGKAPRSSVRVV